MRADEKSQIRALHQTQPLLPMRLGQAERGTRNYKRHRAASLFAALDIHAAAMIALSRLEPSG